MLSNWHINGTNLILILLVTAMFSLHVVRISVESVALGLSRHVHNFISYECFPGEEPVTRRMKGTSEQQLGQKRSSGGKNVASLLSVLSFHMYV